MSDRWLGLVTAAVAALWIITAELRLWLLRRALRPRPPSALPPGVLLLALERERRKEAPRA